MENKDNLNAMRMILDLVAEGKVSMILRPTGDLIIMSPDSLDKHYSKFQARMKVQKDADASDDPDLGV